MDISSIYSGAHNFVDPRRQALLGLASGLLSSPTWSGGLSNGFAQAAQGKIADDAYATSQKAEAQRQEQLNQSIEALQKYPDLVAALKAGDSPQSVFNEMFQRNSPGYGDPTYGKPPVDPTSTASGRQQLGKDNGLTGQALQEYVLTGKLPPGADNTAPTLTSIYDSNGREQKGYMKGDQFVPVGSPKAAIERPEYTNTQALAAGFADRMKQADAILDNPALATAQTDVVQKGLSGVPVVGNMMTSPEFQQADQAQRDFINAILRRESGAAIAQSEFDSARKQYFPQPGDSKEVLLQKKQNRLNAIKGVSRSAGPAYVGEGGDNAPNDLSGLSDEELLKQLGN